MPLDWTPFVDFVHKHQRFVLMTHIRPDGDALGSELGMAHGLRQLGKSVHVVIASSLPRRYDFLNRDPVIERYEPPGDCLADSDAVIIVDTGTWNQLGEFGDFLRNRTCDRFVIDHHLTQDDLGGQRLVDTSAEACGRLVYEALQSLQVTPSPAAAHALFVALATDTGWFRHSSTRADTFQLASQLVQLGAKPDEAYVDLFEKSPLPKLKLMGLALGRMEVCEDGRLAHTSIHLDDYIATGAHPMDTEDLSGYTRTISGVEVGLIFIEQAGGGVKVSFRSRQVVDVGRLAESFGGGGHRLASGAFVPGDLADVRSRVLQAAQAAIRQSLV